MSPETTRLFEDARNVDLVEYAGTLTKLKRAGREWRGACPLCGAGAKSSTPPFAVNPDKRVWVCHVGCVNPPGGDVIDLVQQMRPGSTPKEAAAWLIGADMSKLTPSAPKPRETPKASPVAAAIWRESVPAAGTIVEAYLAARWISAGVIAATIDRLRFHPRAPHTWDADARAWSVRAPAMIVRPETVDGPVDGVHATYLRPDGSGKADLSPAKRMWGAQLDAEGRRGGAWLIGPDGAGPLVVGEGIETVLSVCSMKGTRCRAVAALSLGGLQGGVLHDEDGALDLRRPQPDPDRKPFAWPNPGEVWIAVDHDMAPVDVVARNIRGRICRFRLDATGRAELCARVAGRAWRGVGASPVKLLTPPRGQDFSNVLSVRSRP